MNQVAEKSLWIKDMMLLEDENCFNGLIPENIEGRTVKVAEGLATMPKYFFRANRAMMLAYLNECRTDGRLSSLVGFPFYDAPITRQTCEFTTWDMWRIDQKNFYTDVYFTLGLNTERGLRMWKGYLEIWCSLDDDFICTVEEIGGMNDLPDHSGEYRLSPFMVPYMHGNEVDKECEKIWGRVEPDAIKEHKKRDAEKLADSYGLSVKYLPVYGTKAASTLFFAEGTILVKAGNRVLEEPGMEKWKKEDDEKNPPEVVKILANTIVVNTNRIEKEHAAYCIFHECVHYEFHYMFHRLQEMANVDVRNVKTKEIILKPNEKISDPIYWMEKQANRGACGLLMPISWMREEVSRAWENLPKCRHMGDVFDVIGRRICAKNKLPNFLMKSRLIQMGHIEAQGALTWLMGGIKVEPFAFDVNNCRDVQKTFVIEKFASGALYEKDEDFRRLFDTGKFIWADGHIVRKDSRFIRETPYGLRLTPWANEHVDQCCLRFVRIYVQDSLGNYVFGRMNLDEDYIKKTMFYLEDDANKGIVNEMKAEQEYSKAFPASFAEGLKKLMDKNDITVEQMAEKLHVDLRTFQRWMADPEKKFTEDFVLTVCLILELPDWISDLLFESAGVRLSKKDDRHLAFEWIRRAMWNDGVEKANEYLKSRKQKPLKFKGQTNY